MTSRDDLIGVLEKLYIPRVASSGLESMIHTGQAAIKASILLFASGDGDKQPDLVGWLDERNLLSDDGLDEPPGQSVMAENYGSRQDDVNAKKKEMDRQSRNVKDSALETFSLANRTYMSIKDRIVELDKDLRDINERTNEKGAYLPLTAGEEVRALRYVVQAVDNVHDQVDDSSTQIRRKAAGINDSRPSFVSAPRGSGSSGPTYAIPSNASYDPTGNGTVEEILSRARHELELGVHEISGNNVAAYYENGKLVTRPYNINDAWCASFASWVWDKAGYKVNWTNKNYVPSIWSDAYTLGLRRNSPSQAQPGDMIIFDWRNDGEPDHIGIVESVNGNSITTIEGNSTDRVQRNDSVKRNNYYLGDPRLVGVVRPPVTQSVAV